MRFMLKFKFPHERGNQALQDPKFGAKIQKLLQDIRAEASYFGLVDGLRGGYIVVNVDDASKIVSTVEPFFLWLNADVEMIPVMTAEDLGKGSQSFPSLFENWKQ